MSCRVALAAALAVISSAANAHVTLAGKEAPADSYYVARFQVPHGCQGAPTQSLKVQIPEGVTSVKPQPKAGWTLKIVKTKLDRPVTDRHGNTATERVSEIDWTGGDLPDAYFDEFLMQVHLPDTPGKTIYFPTVQECKDGKVTRWIDIPTAGKSAHDYKEPAPGVRLLTK
jgi:uncharacterized protein YcnI